MDPTAVNNSSCKDDPAAFRRVMELRSSLVRVLRNFFYDRNFLEVETPVRLACPALETHIDAEPSGACYLRTSPELHMKRLMCAGYERIFQMGPCFRQGELGGLHHPEYTMLEWYRAGADYMRVLADTKALVAEIAMRLNGTTELKRGATRVELMPVWEVMPVSQAFRLFAGWDPAECFDAERFDLDLVNKVEPNLPVDHPVILMDYPVQAGAFARRKPGHPELAERWELYICGIELANAFSELTDPYEQRRRFEGCAAERKAMGKPVYPMDERFLSGLEKGMPESAGVALGIDRLVMVFSGQSSLDSVLPFRDECR